jgi:hypothetical protein
MASVPGSEIRVDEQELRGHLDEVVRSSVEETLNGLLEAEAHRKPPRVPPHRSLEGRHHLSRLGVGPIPAFLNCDHQFDRRHRPRSRSSSTATAASGIALSLDSAASAPAAARSARPRRFLVIREIMSCASILPIDKPQP